MAKPRIDLDRRTFLKGAVGSTTALVVSTAYGKDLLAQESDYMRMGYSFLSPSEVPIVEALAEQIWPATEDTIGGRDAGVAVYIDRALTGAYMDMQAIYRLGLDWVDQTANQDFGGNFADLSNEDQIAFLETYLGMPETAASATPQASPVTDDASENLEVEGMPLPGQDATPAAGGQGGGSTGALAEAGSGQASGGDGTIAGAPMLAGGDPPEVEDVAGFLQIFRTHTIEGLFADPIYGGNRDKQVWADLNYGGPYYVHTEEQQLTMDSPLDIPIQSIADL